MICVLLVDPLELMRRSLIVALQEASDIAIVGQGADVEEAASSLGGPPPDVAVLASTELAMRADQAVRSLRDRYPAAKVVLVVGPGSTRGLLGAVEAGISACLTHSTTVKQLTDAIRVAHDGGTMMDPDALAALFQQVARSANEPSQATSRLAQLTRQELRVLALLTEGLRNEAIARRLNISPHTARTHVQRVLAKLSVHSRLEAVAFVNRHDLLSRLEANDR